MRNTSLVSDSKEGLAEFMKSAIGNFNIRDTLKIDIQAGLIMILPVDIEQYVDNC